MDTHFPNCRRASGIPHCWRSMGWPSVSGSRAGAQSGVTLAGREPDLAEMPRPGFFIFSASNFPAGIFFNFSESAQTPSHMPLLREAPLLASDPVAPRGGAVCERWPGWARVCFCSAGCRQLNQINSPSIHHDVGACVNSIFTISAGLSPRDLCQFDISIRIILIMEYFRVSCRDPGSASSC